MDYGSGNIRSIFNMLVRMKLKTKVSSGPKNLEKSRKMVRSMIKTVEKKLFLKNRNSCMFCEFKNTDYCK